MKRIAWFFLAALAAFAQNGDNVETLGDDQFVGPVQMPDRWDTRQACEAALVSGRYRVYQPTYFNLHRNLRQGEVSKPPEHSGCARMQVVGGYKFVIVPGAETDKPVSLIWREGPGGILTPVAREDCGNRITEFHYPPPPTPVAPPPGRLICVTKRGYDRVSGQLVEIPWNVKLESFTFALSDGQKTATGGETRHSCFANPGIVGQKYTVTEDDTDPAKWRLLTAKTVEFVLQPGEGEYTVEFKNEQIVGIPPTVAAAAACFNYGNLMEGFKGGATGNFDRLAYYLDADKEPIAYTTENLSAGIQMPVNMLPDLAPGQHTLMLKAFLGNQVVAECPQPFDKFGGAPPTEEVERVPPVRRFTVVEEPGFCSRDHNIFVKIGTVVYCHPVASAIVAGTATGACLAAGKWAAWGPCKGLFTVLRKGAVPAAGSGKSW